MKLRPRRATSSPEETAAGRDPAAPGPGASPGARAVFARVLDGESLWVAVGDAAAGSGVAVGGPDGPILLRDDSGAARSPYLSVRARLGDLGLPVGAHDLLLGSETAGWAPLLAGALPDPAPTRAPASPDGRWQYDVERTGNGQLRLSVARLETGVPLARLELDGDAVVVHLEGDPASTTDLLLVGGDEAAPLVRVPADPAYRVEREHLAQLGGWKELRLLADLPDGPVPVQRRDNDLAQPSRAVVLPDVGEAPPLARFRFDREGRLLLRRVEGVEDDA